MEVAAGEDQDDVGFAECACCGLTEECTSIYLASVQNRYGGRWICGLCAEAVEEETCRSAPLISTEEALQRQTSFYLRFRSQVDATDHLIAIVRRLLRLSRGLKVAPRKEPTDSSLPVVIGSQLGGVGDADLLGLKPSDLRYLTSGDV